jgi:glucose-6-phosphate 1-dehydrogenase
MIQNHVFQILALVAMGLRRHAANSVRDEDQGDGGCQTY